uniref:Protein kinase domain-containing protein n=1 Tax=viral metagenome TaxID=1070528 RepID=A0A6C0CJS8_9ZZZZ
MEDKSEKRKIFLENIMAEKRLIGEQLPNYVPKYKRVYNKAKRFVKKYVMNGKTTPTSKQYTQLRNPHSKLKRLIDYQQELVFENRVPTNIHELDKSLLKPRAKLVKHVVDRGADVTEPEHIKPAIPGLRNPKRGTPVDSTGTSEAKTHTQPASMRDSTGKQPTLRRQSAEPAKPRPNEKLVELANNTLRRLRRSNLVMLRDIRSKTIEQLNTVAKFLIDNQNDKSQLTRRDLMLIEERDNLCTYTIGPFMIKFARKGSYELLEHEIYILSALNQARVPNIAIVVDHGKHGDVPYFCMPGLQTYKRLSDVYNFDFEYLPVLSQIETTLERLHSYEFAHYNLILRNIMFDETTQKVCIIDFSRACYRICMESDNSYVSENPASYPSYYMTHYRDKVATFDQGIKTDCYFLAVAALFIISKGSVDPTQDRTREAYFSNVKTFIQTCKNVEEITRIRKMFINSAIDQAETDYYIRTLTPDSSMELKLPSKSRSKSKSNNQNLEFDKAAGYIIEFNNNKFIEYARKTELRLIGQGTYGYIYKLGNLHVIKFPKIEYISALNREINIFKELNKLEHTNIIKATYWGKYNDIPFLVLPYLTDYVNLYTVAPMNIEYQYIYKQIVSALTHLHKNGFAHFDLSPNNVMYNKTTGHICIIDFGLSCMKACDGVVNNDLRDNPMVPPYWGTGRMTLERGQHVDYYFLGVLMVMMLSKGTITPYYITRDQYTKQVDNFKASYADKMWVRVITDLFSIGLEEVQPLIV